MVALVWLAVAVALGFFAGMSHGSPRWMMTRREKQIFDFQKIFGIRQNTCPDYYRDLDGWCMLVQNVVDRVLKNYAKVLHAAYQEETYWKNEAAQQSSPGRHVLNNLRSASKKILNLKPPFWQAHGLAKYFGYNVRKSYKDYLLADEEWEAKETGALSDGFE